MYELKYSMDFKKANFLLQGITSRFHVKDSIPKTWKKIDLISRQHSSDESGLVYIFKNRQGTLFAGTYVSGCFNVQFAKIEFLDDTLLRIVNYLNEVNAEKTIDKEKLRMKYNLTFAEF